MGIVFSVSDITGSMCVVTLKRKWSHVLLLCYLSWALETVYLVGCTSSHVTTVKDNFTFNVVQNHVFFENGNGSVCNISKVIDKSQNNITGARNGACNSELVEEKRKLYTTVHATPGDATALRIVRNVVSQLQVHVPVSPNTVSEVCRNQSRILLDRIQQFDMWSLKMIDSSAKLTSGLLNGNVNQYGDFDQCLNVATYLDSDTYPGLENRHVKGKYCLALMDLELEEGSRTNDLLREIDDLIHAHRLLVSTVNDPGHRIPRFSTISWGFCIPASCSAEDLSKSLSESLQKYLSGTEISLRIKVKPDLCYIKDSKPISLGTKLTIVFFASVIVLVIIGTWVDTNEPTLNQGKTLLLVRAFSLRRNIRTLMETENTSNEIKCLNGLRTLNALALLAFHKSVALYFNPFVNRTHMAETFGKSWSVIGRTSALYTDTFLVISGLLTAYNQMRELERNNGIKVREKYLARYIRFTPNLLAIILFCTYIMDHLGSGPLWNLVVKHHSDICQNNMWRNFLYIQNYFGFENICLNHTHHLAIDMQLFIVSPIFVYLLWRNRRLGLAVLMLCVVLSGVLRYTVTYNKHLSNIIYFGAPVSRLFDSATYSYSQTTHRASVYFIGMAAGYFIQQTKPSVTLSKVHIALGWTASLMMGVLALCGPYHTSYPTYQYNRYEAALYSALSPILWGTFLGWPIFAAYKGYGGVLNDFMSWRGFVVFNRISYSVYLTQFLVFFYNVGTRRTADYFSPHLLFEVGEVSFIILASIVLTLLFDLPSQELKRALWKQDPKYTKKCDKSLNKRN